LQIENRTLYFRERAQSKCGTFDYLDHRPGGGDKKVFCKARYQVDDLFICMYGTTSPFYISFCCTIYSSQMRNSQLNLLMYGSCEAGLNKHREHIIKHKA